VQTLELRRLSPDDVEVYREIRLESLRSSPEAFGATYEQESARPLDWFRDRLGRTAVFGAFYGGELVGTAGYYRQSGAKYQHKGALVGMYVRPHARRRGAGSALIRAIAEYAATEVELIQLCVITTNQAARNLYRRNGFTEYGLERHALKQNGRYFDEVLMAKMLTSDSST
jgi:ribosomal protein S18 acetylase RimI-like enzyme